MADDTGQTQQQNQGEDSGGQVGKTTKTNPGPQTTGPQSTGDTDRTVPYHRFAQVNEDYKAVKQQLAEIQSEQERIEEERAQKQGEYQKLADKYKTQAQQEKEKRQQVEKSWERERLLNVWIGAAAGVVKPEAIVDAFGMLDDDDFKGIDTQDEAQVRNVAERLVERRAYLADGPVGAGSGGSERQILGNPRSPNGQTKDFAAAGSDVKMTSSGRMIFPKKNKRAWT